MKEKLENLYNEDNNSAYKTLLELETITTESNELYSYFEYLLEMLNSKKTFIRVRGFRLICFLSKWDNEDKINKNIEVILNVLEDEKGTSVRQCLEKLSLILMYKIELTEVIKNKIKNLDLSKYKGSMQSLIRKDIKNIYSNLENLQDKKILFDNIDKIHTTEMGIDRIRKNLKIDTKDVVVYCKNKVMDKNCNIYKQGKNWYCEVDNIKITINSYSYTIITAHIIK